jgi:hypothetical protein
MTLAVHLGLTEAIAKVVGKVAQCERCATFWGTAFVLWMNFGDVVAVIALSIVAAYLSYWIGIGLIILQHLYNKSWEKLNQLGRNNHKLRRHRPHRNTDHCQSSAVDAHVVNEERITLTSNAHPK